MRKILSFAVVLTLLLGLGLAGCKIRGDDPPTWHLEDLTALNTEIGEDWGLYDVDAAGWAVGMISSYIDMAYHPLVIRRVGEVWQVEDIGQFADLEAILVGVGVAPNGDVWCVGYETGEGSEPLILVKTGAEWKRIEQEVGQEPGWPSTLVDVAFEDAHNTYVVGGGSILRFVDQEFDPEGSVDPDGTLTAIDWADQGYAAGDDGLEVTKAAIYQSTTDFGTNTIDGLNLFGPILNGIDVIADGTGWAVGFSEGASTGERTLFIRREGGSWAQDTDFSEDFSFTRDPELNDVATLSATRAFAVGQEGTDGVVLSYVAHRMVDMEGQLVERPWDFETAAMDLVGGEGVLGWTLNAIDASSERRAFAAGWLEDTSKNTLGVILRYE